VVEILKYGTPSKSGAEFSRDEVRLWKPARTQVVIHIVNQYEWGDNERNRTPPSEKQGRERIGTKVFPDTRAAKLAFNFLPLSGYHHADVLPESHVQSRALDPAILTAHSLAPLGKSSPMLTKASQMEWSQLLRDEPFGGMGYRGGKDCRQLSFTVGAITVSRFCQNFTLRAGPSIAQFLQRIVSLP